jgi:hypothetical protein
MQSSLPMYPSPRCQSPDAGWDALPIAGDAERTVPDARGLSPGAPKGNRNAFKNGRYTAEAVARRRELAALLRSMRGLASRCEKIVAARAAGLSYSIQHRDCHNEPHAPSVRWT